MNLLVDEYGLRVLPKKKPVIDLDDLYLLSYTHWVLDTATYMDERQRVQVATGIFMAGFFGCRPCSLFDTRVKLDDSQESDESLNTAAVIHATNGRNGVEGGRRRTCRGNDTLKLVDPGCEIGDDEKDDDDEGDSSPMTTDGKSDNGNDSDGDSDSESDYESEASSVDACDGDSYTDDECDAGPEKTRTFLYRHFTIAIVPNETPGKPNLVFMKATLLHT